MEHRQLLADAKPENGQVTLKVVVADDLPESALELLRAEAVASSRIEGLELSHRRIARADFDPKEADATAREVLGNLREMEKAIAIATRRRPFAC